MTVYRFWCEWDIGINDCLWADRYQMEEDVVNALSRMDLPSQLVYLEEEGLIGFEAVDVI